MTRPLHIGLVCRFGPGWQGGVEYLRNLAASLESLDAEEKKTFQLTLVYPDEDSENTSIIGSEAVRRVFYKDYRPIRRPFSERVAIRIKRSLPGGDLTRFEHFLNDLDLDFLYPYQTETPERHSFHYASWIPDLQHRFLTDMFSNEDIEIRNVEYARAARLAPCVVLSSQTAREHFAEFYPDAVEKTRILSFATLPIDDWLNANLESTVRSYGLPDRFFALPNQFWKHKNHSLVFQALANLRDSDVRPIVVCTGPLFDNRRPQFSSEILQQIQKLGLAGQVILLGLLPKQDQIQLLRRSLAILQPSLFEGWSTVVEEARSLGKSILLSDIPVHREQNPPMAEFFDPHSPDCLAELLHDAWKRMPIGPDIAKETKAQSEGRESARRYAREFIQLARESL